MSGAGVLLPDGRMVGVVVEAQADHENRRLYVVPLATALASSPRLAAAWATVTGEPITIEPREPQAVRTIRSAYLQQVENIAPLTLEGRDAELADLAAFCARSTPARYRWLRAPAWAGKSALLAWFVLHPPPGVRVVSFFITARLAGQDNWVAFTDVLLEQLAELLGESSLPYLTEATRGAHLSRMLGDAAAVCRRQGQLLLLVVDGLDEDRGANTDPDAHSIAAMLPLRPPDGLRIIVAGRLNPPLPSDVPEEHPLRAPGITRYLQPSERAQAVKADAQRELKRLLKGTADEQDLLGLLTAAAGGLSGSDLAELTGCLQWIIEEHLHAVSGRTFGARSGRWRQDTRTYLLGHEELQQEAIRLLGAARLDEYRRQLHTWADRYRDRQWPEETPEYLVSDYFRLLKITDDVPRMLACATDFDRHDRMLRITGGDSAAVTEITAAQDSLFGQTDFDLESMVRLAIHRDALGRRNANIPKILPALWARLGHPSRAEALARSIINAGRQARALVDVAGAIAKTDPDRAEEIGRSISDPRLQSQVLAGIACEVAGVDQIRARRLIRAAESTARSISDGYQPTGSISELAQAIAWFGPDWPGMFTTPIGGSYGALADVARTVAPVDPDRAEMIARSIDQRYGQEAVLADVARGVASADPDRAEMIARSISDRREQEAVLADVARRVASVDLDRAETIVGSIRDSHLAVEVMAEIAQTAASDDIVRARSLFEAADLLVRSMSGRGGQSRGQFKIALAMAAFDPSRAEMIARSIGDRGWRAQALAQIARAVAGVDLARARKLAEASEMIARSLGDRARRLEVLSEVASAVASVEPKRAEAIARSIDDSDRREEVLSEVASAVARVEPERAEAIARSIGDWESQVKVLAEIAQVVAAVDPDRAHDLAELAESMCRSTSDPYHRAKLLVEVARVLADSDPDRCLRLTEAAGTIAQSISDLRPRSDVLGEVALVEAGVDPERAETTARSISDRHRHADVLAKVAGVVAAIDPERAEATASSIADPHGRARATAEVARVVASTDPERGERLARSIADKSSQAEALSDIARAVAGVDPDRAETIASSIGDQIWQARAFTDIVRALIPVDLERAKSIASSISVPYRRACALADVAQVVAAFDPDQAEATARSIGHGDFQAQALAQIAGVVARTDPERARSLAQAAEARARSIVGSYRRTEVLAKIVQLVAAFDPDHAETVARSINDQDRQDQALTEVAQALAATEPGRADAIAGSINNRNRQARALANVAREVARVDSYRARSIAEHALTVAGSIFEPAQRADAASYALQAVARTDPDWVEMKIRSISDPTLQFHLLTRLAIVIETDRAYRFIALVLRNGDWPACVTALARVHMSSVRVIADELLRIQAWLGGSSLL